MIESVQLTLMNYEKKWRESHVSEKVSATRKHFTAAARFLKQVGDPRIYGGEPNSYGEYFRPSVADVEGLPRRYRPTATELNNMMEHQRTRAVALSNWQRDQDAAEWVLENSRILYEDESPEGCQDGAAGAEQ